MGLLDAPAFPRSKTMTHRPQTVVVFGDSLTEQGGEIPSGDAYGVAHSAPGAPRSNPDTRSFAAWTWANTLLNQAFTVLANYGIGGETTTQILARVPDVIALNPGWVWITAGTNDVNGAVSFATTKANFGAMFDAFDAAGIRVAVLTLPPRLAGSYSGTAKADTLAINEWLRQQARLRPSLVVADIWPSLADGSSSNYVSTLWGFNPTSDGVHLSATGGYAAGKVLAEALRPYVTTNVVPFSNPSPGANLLTSANARPAGTTTSDATGWSGTGTPTYSDVVRTDGVGGSWKQYAVASGTIVRNTNATVDGTRLAIGDTINGILEFSVSSMDQAAANDAQGIALYLRSWNGSAYTSTVYAFNYYRQPNVDHAGVLRTPDFVVPSGTTLVSLTLELRGSMTFKFDRPGIYARKTYPV
jgi:lysophospholipase L1-like esterase